jgi:hypothetical protein
VTIGNYLSVYYDFSILVLIQHRSSGVLWVISKSHVCFFVLRHGISYSCVEHVDLCLERSNLLACLAMFVYLSSVVLVYKVRWLTLNYYNSWLIDIEAVKEFVIVGSKENEITITNPAKYEETPGNINSTTEKRTRCTSVMTIWTLLCFHIVYQFSLQQFVYLC